ncbi:NAD(P)H-dependent oxidoreductase [Sphingomonas abaci]|uniref:NAD(P)H dehydrogenase (Quinone) n=1 Tax=Sphingomonas abaci TaxID=237611 RepID=A0A7W7AM71_9SPHN|nr:NAD(P)H-dependent oxidoreductase [Sphingomonas abaci]MBB4619628.1 NAD(P)H dehydrogenase (quinone) [Sphingomonas abaci]
MNDTATPAAPATFNHLVVLANPAPDGFDHSIVAAYAQEVERHHQAVQVRDLYALGFDPVLRASERPTVPDWSPAPDITAELDYLRHCDILVFVYPIWFGLPPAMLKGYVERVLGAGYSFRDLQASVGQPSVAGKPLLSFSTSGTSLPWLDEQGQVLSLKDIFDVYLWRGLGMSQADHVRIDCVVPDMSSAYAGEQLERVRQAAEKACAQLASGRYHERAEAALQRRRTSLGHD